MSLRQTISLQQHSRVNVVQCRPVAKKSLRVSVIPRAFVGDVSKYLAEAAAQIFHPTEESDVPWERSAEPFVGSIAHHEELHRLRHLNEVVKYARKSLEGCTDPSAANYDPAAKTDDGSCTYATEQPSDAEAASIQDFVSSTLDRVFGHNFVGDETEPAKYFSTGYTARGRTQRELRRDVDRLRRFEQVVSKTIESAEQK